MTLTFIRSCVSGHLMNTTPIFTLHLAPFWSSPTPGGNNWLFSCFIMFTRRTLTFSVSHLVLSRWLSWFFRLFVARIAAWKLGWEDYNSELNIVSWNALITHPIQFVYTRILISAVLIKQNNVIIACDFQPVVELPFTNNPTSGICCYRILFCKQYLSVYCYLRCLAAPSVHWRCCCEASI